jgi:hypothetical protein
MLPSEALVAGARDMQQVFAPHGFAFALINEGRGSGGAYASGEYRRGNRRLELHYRNSLGLVAYHVGEVSLAHADYVRAVSALTGASALPSYPGFSTDNPLVAFSHLCHDLELFGSIFLHGSDQEFASLRLWVNEHPRPKGIAALS